MQLGLLKSGLSRVSPSPWLWQVLVSPLSLSSLRMPGWTNISTALCFRHEMLLHRELWVHACRFCCVACERSWGDYFRVVYKQSYENVFQEDGKVQMLIGIWKGQRPELCSWPEAAQQLNPSSSAQGLCRLQGQWHQTCKLPNLATLGASLGYWKSLEQSEYTRILAFV